MNWVTSALDKQQEKRQQIRREAGAESGTDWATTLLFNCLHLYEFQEGFIYDWRDELEKYGFNRFDNEKIAEKMQRIITGPTKDRVLMAHTRDMVAGVAIVIFWTMYSVYGWRKKRITDLFGYYKDKVYVLTHGEVPIWEFMKCLNVECGVEYPALDEYERINGPVDIYGGNKN